MAVNDFFLGTIATTSNISLPEELGHLIRHIAGLNYQKGFDETALLTGIRHMGSPDIKHLIHYGCDVNLPDQLQRTPLHLAVLQGNVDMARHLLEHGGDLNVQDLIAQETPLFYAIKSDNIELACMLLCYGADVTIKNAQSHIPIDYALVYRRWDIVSILIDYYDDFNDGDKDGYMPLHFAIYYAPDLAIQLIDRGADVNYVTDEGYCMLEYAMNVGRVDLFKKIWGKINIDILLEAEIPVVITYAELACYYSTKGWVECLHLLLESSVAADLIDHASLYMSLQNASLYMSLQNSMYPTTVYSRESFIAELLYSLHRKGVPSGDRQNIISICLSLGAEVTATDLCVAMYLYGFEEELEMLIYATDSYETDDVFHPLLRLVLGSSDMKLPDMILRYKKYIRCECHWIVPTAELIDKFMVGYRRFFSLTPFWKLELLRNWQPISNSDFIFEENIKLACEFPSLLELSRNRVHSLVREGRKPQKPYQFFDAMKSLPLPGAVIDILLFKNPIYTCPH